MANDLSRWNLVCPHDKAVLAGDEMGLSCPTCKRRFPTKNGVVRFVEKDDAFYEGAYNNQIKFVPRNDGLLASLPLWLINSGYVWAARKYLKPGARVVELGCAGGVVWFGRRFDMAGVDLSREGLELAARNYGVCLQADSAHLPFADGEADAVFSSYFWEHIAPHDKPRFLQEIHRVLRPGGLILFLYDVATENPLISILRKRDPKRYDAMFIECDGHLGYQSPDENDALFRQNGFTILKSVPMERWYFQSLSTYDKMREWPGLPGRIGRGLGFLHSRLLFYPYQGMLRLFDDTIGRLLPRRWGRIAMTIAAKR